MLALSNLRRLFLFHANGNTRHFHVTVTSDNDLRCFRGKCKLTLPKIQGSACQCTKEIGVCQTQQGTYVWINSNGHTQMNTQMDDKYV